ncbi:MAG: dTDP-glucose 4,6-dehydratase [Thermoguttaceae bacterium]
MTRFLVTGGAGFIGSELVRYILSDFVDSEVVNVDKLTYAGNLDSLRGVCDLPQYRFVNSDIGNAPILNDVFAKYRPEVVINLAAETHVDRSIASPAEFIETNILSTFRFLEVIRNYFEALPDSRRDSFRLLHVSTDEVYGTLGPKGAFSEKSPYKPRNPYSASKASADHLVKAWHSTYGIPALISNSSNNFGPFQFPEKLIPQTILFFLHDKNAQIHGDGLQVRDWLHVSDHVRGLRTIWECGEVGATYMLGGENQVSVFDVIQQIALLLDEMRPDTKGSYKKRIEYCPERQGNDRRYSVDATLIQSLGWTRNFSFESGLRQTVAWYLANESWWKPIWEKQYTANRHQLDV